MNETTTWHIQAIEDLVNVTATTKLLIEDEKIIECKLRDDVILQHTTSTNWWAAVHVQYSTAVPLTETDTERDRQTDTDTKTDRHRHWQRCTSSGGLIDTQPQSPRNNNICSLLTSITTLHSPYWRGSTLIPEHAPLSYVPPCSV